MSAAIDLLKRKVDARSRLDATAAARCMAVVTEAVAAIEEGHASGAPIVHAQVGEATCAGCFTHRTHTHCWANQTGSSGLRQRSARAGGVWVGNSHMQPHAALGKRDARRPVCDAISHVASVATATARARHAMRSLAARRASAAAVTLVSSL